MIKRRIYTKGPIINYTELFRSHLLEQGYNYNSATNLVGVWKTLNFWMYQNQIPIRLLNYTRLNLFVKYRKRKGYVEWNSMKGLKSIIIFLSKTFKINLTVNKDVSLTDLDRLVRRYSLFLQNDNKVITQKSLNLNLAEITYFLKSTFANYSQFKNVQIYDIRKYLLKKIETYEHSTVRDIAGIFRKFFRWCFVNRTIKKPLHIYIPKISAVGQRVPKSVPEKKIKLLLKGCDRRTQYGRKNFVIFSLMSDLGLRMCEVVNLTLDDIDWKNGVLVVRGKNKESTLPLSDKIGKILISYLKKDRPDVQFRNFFIRDRAPYGGITVSTIQTALREICKKNGIEKIRGHQLRHTVATQMLKNGSSMYEISQVLRHNSISNTAIYAKVDKDSLIQVVQLWPGSKK